MLHVCCVSSCMPCASVPRAFTQAFCGPACARTFKFIERMVVCRLPRLIHTRALVVCARWGPRTTLA
eukprot:14036021-Alexandrium_andersonii.AAC.1